MARTFTFDGSPLRLEDLHDIGCAGSRFELSPAGRERMADGRDVVERALASGEAVYGVNTGFGSLARVRIDAAGLKDLQRNLVRSHAAGVGAPLEPAKVRVMMAILAASLSRGRSGVRPVVVERLCAMLNEDVVPIVPSRGSVGASGDLAPLAHVALALIGEGESYLRRVRTRSGLAMRACGIDPLELAAKEGLALINGTHMMLAVGGSALLAAERLFRAGLRVTALSIDAALASDAFLDPRLHDARGQPGQREVAATLARELEGSQIVPSHRDDDPRVQDPYSLRCAPQVQGAVLDTFRSVRGVMERELGAVTDNPLVFSEDGSIRSGGNFHGMPLAIALDSAKIALCHAAGISERRTFWILSMQDPYGRVKPHLALDPGLHSGLMIAQYAAAACCNELQTLCAPASIANISTSAGMEDYNSFGATSAHQFDRAVALARSVIAIEMLCAAQALECHRPLRSGVRVEATMKIIRAQVPALKADRVLSPDIAAIENLISQGAFDD